MRKTIGKILVPTLVLLLLAASLVLYVMYSPAEARPVSGQISDKLGAYTGAGSGQTHNVYASLQLAHTDLDLLIRNATSGLLGLGNGNVYYVDSAGDGTDDGLSWTNAALTLNAAIGLIGTASEEDTGAIILVAPGHAETLAAGDAVDIDEEDVSIIGLGSGENRPKLSYTANGEIVFGADDCAIYNLWCHATADSVIQAIDIEANVENWKVVNCVFDTTTPGTHEFDDAIIGAAGCYGGLIKDCLFDAGGVSNGDTQSAIMLLDSDYTQIIDNRFFGDYAVAAIEQKTTAADFMVIEDNLVFNGIIGGDAGLNALPCISLASDTTGIIRNNVCICNVATPEDAIVAADCYLSGNTYSEMEGTAGSRPIGLQGRFGNVNICRTTTGTMDSTNYAAGTTTIFTVTGDILCRACATFSTQITSDSSETLELGVVGNTAILLVSDVAGGTAFDVGDTWTKETAADADGALMDIEWIVVSGGIIGLTIADQDLAAGVANFYLEWIGLSADAEVVGSAP